MQGGRNAYSALVGKREVKDRDRFEDVYRRKYYSASLSNKMNECGLD